jgi:hypothetical protein
MPTLFSARWEPAGTCPDLGPLVPAGISIGEERLAKSKELHKLQVGTPPPGDRLFDTDKVVAARLRMVINCGRCAGVNTQDQPCALTGLDVR